MNRLVALAAPVALLTTACGVRTPATALDARQVASPSVHEVELPSVAEAVTAWQLPPTSPWARYEKLTLLTYLADTPVMATMPDVRALDVVARAELAAARVASSGVPADTMWIVDLRGAASVAFGARLSRESSQAVAPVLTFNNWPAENEVVPAEQTLSALVSMAPRTLPAGEVQAAPVFLLDAWRLALRDATPDPTTVDNRYILLSSDFPDAATLLARGIRRVIYVVEDRGETSTEEDDVHDVALAYQAAGIPLSLVDLGQLAGMDVIPPEQYGERWAYYLDDWRLEVQVRSTIFDDPGFYHRARGGFGGVRAAPVGRTYVPAHPTGAWAGEAHAGGRAGGRAFSGASPHVGGAGHAGGG
jgi:hypothetical protein